MKHLNEAKNIASYCL